MRGANVHRLQPWKEVLVDKAELLEERMARGHVVEHVEQHARELETDVLQTRAEARGLQNLLQIGLCGKGAEGETLIGGRTEEDVIGNGGVGVVGVGVETLYQRRQVVTGQLVAQRAA